MKRDKRNAELLAAIRVIEQAKRERAARDGRSLDDRASELIAGGVEPRRADALAYEEYYDDLDAREDQACDEEQSS